MKKITALFFSLFCLVFAVNAFAAKDPISWSVSPTSGFPAATTGGSAYVVSYTMTNNLPFAKALSVSLQYTGGSFSITNGCNTTLAPKGSCTMYVVFQPTKAGQSTARLILAYDKNRVPLPQLSSTASSVETPTDRITGAVTTPLPAATYVGTIYPVGFTFANNGDNAHTASSLSVNGFTPTFNTCTSALAPNSTCIVFGSFSPVTTGPATLSVTYNYTNGKSYSVPLSTQTVVNPTQSVCHQVNGFTTLPLPTSTLIYADNVVQYQFMNNCNVSSETVGQVSITSDATTSPPTLTKGTDTCSGKTIPANGTCTVTVSVIPNATTGAGNDLSVSASLPFSGSTQAATATTSAIVNAIPNQSTQHTVFFVNQCNQGVWYEFQNGVGGSGANRKSPDPTPTNQRTFQNYQLDQQLTGAAPATKILSFNEYVNGAIYGRTGCSAASGTCLTANCPVIQGTATCQPAVGANNPATIFEEDMDGAVASDGVYDISLINGFNLPGEFRSLAPQVNPLNFNNACGQSAGAVIQPMGSPLGICPWTFTPPSTLSPDQPENYNWVSSGPDDGCASTSSCTGGQICGEAYSTGVEGTAPINRRCGTFQGYWTIASYAGYSSASQWGSVDLYTAYGLGTALPLGPTGMSYGTVGGVAATYANMYGCTPTSNGSLKSGYGAAPAPSPLPESNACGCYNWDQAGSVAPTAQSEPCVMTNSQWINTVFPRISWIKEACPTAYSYQFDDKSVSFTCNVANQKTAYQITYCPAGKTGSPRG
ncbi:MAG: thaumatin family protein [Gammaproteobacteria bacterium]